MGGGVCLSLAVQAARDGVPTLSKMVLIAPVASPTPPPPPLRLIIETVCALVESPDFKDAPLLGRKLAETILRSAYASSSVVTADQIDGYAKGLSSRDQLRAFCAHSRTLSDISFPEAALGGIKIKTLVIWGKEDPFLSFAHGPALAKALGDASLGPIDTCGHIPQEERPADTVLLIENFLKGS